MAQVFDASEDLIRKAGDGPHADWGTFDLRLEGARFHLLHEIVASGGFDGAAALRILDELASLARSYGYGTADSYLTDAEGLTDDEIEADPQLSLMRGNLFDDPEDDQYFNEVRKSERALFAGAATKEARDFLISRPGSPYGPSSDGAYGIVFNRMMNAFESGRDERKGLNAGAAPAP